MAQLMVAELIAEGEMRLLDGTLISCANYPGCAKRSDFAPEAAYGYCPSKSRFVWGLRLVVICDRKGVPVGHDLAGPTTGARERFAPGERSQPVFADGGFWGAEYERTMELIAIKLITPAKPQARATATQRDRQGPHPADHRVGASPTSSARCAWKSTSPRRLWPGTANRAKTARLDTRHLHQLPHRAPTTRARRL